MAIHIAAEVNMLKPYAALAKSNVGGTAHLLDLCARAGGAPVVFTSTIEPLPTEEVTGYRRSKEVAEVLLSKACLTRGLASSILQLGDIGMSSRPGSKLPDNDYIVILLRACIALGLRPEAPWVVNIVGIDPVAEHVVQLAVKAPAPDFVAVPVPVEGAPLPWSQLCTWVSKELPGGGFRTCTLAEWRNSLATAASEGSTAVQQVQLLLPGIEAEFTAKAAEPDMVNGVGHAFTVGEAWCRNLGKALAAEADGNPGIAGDAHGTDEAGAGDDTTRAWACLAPGEDLVPMKVQLPPLGHMDIEMQVTHCGLCGSDMHLIDGEWGESSVYPQICGHEIVGMVTDVGAGVTNIDKGMRVGIGWQKGACLTCKHCLCGDEQFCDRLVCTCCDGQSGGFCDRYRSDSRFAFIIPDALSSAHAAPLLCAGHTVYTPLLETQPGDCVGVLGIGGLGHLALQFAAKRGCQVTAISTSSSKEAEAQWLGAKHFLWRQSDIEAAAGSLDYILVCSSHSGDWKQIVNLLRPKGAICFVGAVKPIEFDVFSSHLKWWPLRKWRPSFLAHSRHCYGLPKQWLYSS